MLFGKTTLFTNLVNKYSIKALKSTHIGNNFDLFVLHLVKDVCVSQRLQQRGSCFYLALQERHKFLQLCASLLKVL